MIGALKLLTNPLAVAAAGAAFTVAGYHLGRSQGYDLGQANAKADQIVADAEASAIIRERVRDALQDIGADASDDDIDNILRGLAGTE